MFSQVVFRLTICFYVFYLLVLMLVCMCLGLFQSVSMCFLFVFSLRIDSGISINKDVVFKKEFNTFQLFFGKSYIG